MRQRIEALTNENYVLLSKLKAIGYAPDLCPRCGSPSLTGFVKDCKTCQSAKKAQQRARIRSAKNPSVN